MEFLQKILDYEQKVSNLDLQPYEKKQISKFLNKLELLLEDRNIIGKNNEKLQNFLQKVDFFFDKLLVYHKNNIKPLSIELDKIFLFHKELASENSDFLDNVQ
jgi:uncharacterized coiled-coil DUF342 family protein